MSRLFFYFLLILFFNEFTFLLFNYIYNIILCNISYIDIYNYANIFNFLDSILFTNSLFIYLSNVELCTMYTSMHISILDSIDLIINEKVGVSFFSNSRNSDDLYQIYCIYFDTKILGNSHVFFFILQPKLFVVPGETSLCFFRVFNNNVYGVHTFSTYTVFPYEYAVFINKIQCFCFEELFISPFETLELPLLFYIHPDIHYFNSSGNLEITLEYILIIRDKYIN